MIYICVAAAILFGFGLGVYERKCLQRDYCPKCGCREECNIGHSVPAAGEVTGCCLCSGKEKGTHND